MLHLCEKAKIPYEEIKNWPYAEIAEVCSITVLLELCVLFGPQPAAVLEVMKLGIGAGWKK